MLRGANFDVWNTLSILIALFLILTGLLKVFSPRAVINTSRELFPWVGNGFHLAAGSILPVLELGLGVMLLLKWKYQEVLVGTSILFGIFFIASIYGQAAGVNTDCGCFGGVITSSFGWGMLARNGVLLMAVIVVTCNQIKRGPEDE